MQAFFRTLTAATVILALTVQPVFAATPQVIKDVNTDPALTVSEAARIGDNLFFVFRHPSRGLELFKMSTTSGSLTLVKEIVAGAADPTFKAQLPGATLKLVSLANGKFVFFANDGTHGVEPWVSDGTAGGTFMLLDINPGTASSLGGGPTEMVAVGSRAYMTAFNDTYGQELWSTDGTTVGTVVLDLNPGDGSSSPNTLSTFSEAPTLLYLSASNGSNGEEPWSVDSTSNTPQMISDVNLGSSGSAPSNFLHTGEELYFVADNGVNGRELFATDDLTTELVIDLFPGSESSFPQCLVYMNANDTVRFIASSSSSSTKELWSTTGFSIGTTLIKDFGASGTFGECERVNGKNVFPLDNSDIGLELWASDGTADGTAVLKNIGVGVAGGYESILGKLSNGPSKLVFLATSVANGTEPWVTDGTSVNTKLLRDLVPSGGSSTPQVLHISSTTIYFAAITQSGGKLRPAIFQTNGTASGTTRIGFLPDGGVTNGLVTNEVLKVGSRIFFEGRNGKAGNELWKTDGTSAGTALVKDISAGAFSSNPFQLTSYKNSTVFFATTPGSGLEPYISNGTKSGTRILKDFTPGERGTNGILYSQVGSKFFFSVVTETRGLELHVTSGTPSSTKLVKDLNPGAADGITSDAHGVYKNKLYFPGSDGAAEGELYRSDGTASGTTLVKDINPGSNGSSPSGFTPFKNKLFFAATTDSEGVELWSTDGTEAGTTLLIDIVAGAGDSSPELFKVAGSKMFFTANNGVHGRELWVTNGTAEGTTLVKDISAGAGDSDFDALYPLGSKVIFRATTDDAGEEPWVSDGTESGTKRLKDIVAGDVGSNPTAFVTRGATAYFLVELENGSEQLWKTNGTAAGTRKVTNLSPGVTWSRFGARRMAVLGKDLLIFSDFGSKGREVLKVRVG